MLHTCMQWGISCFYALLVLASLHVCHHIPDVEWWEASVTVPRDACVLDFVISFYEHFDNNNTLNFKVGWGCVGGRLLRGKR